MLKLFFSLVIGAFVTAATGMIVAIYWLMGALFRLLWLPCWPIVRLARAISGR